MRSDIHAPVRLSRYFWLNLRIGLELKKHMFAYFSIWMMSEDDIYTYMIAFDLITEAFEDDFLFFVYWFGVLLAIFM